MTFAEMEQAMIQVKDNLIVQGELLNRLDKILAESHQDFSERIGALLTIAENHEKRLNTTQNSIQTTQAGMQTMQGAMHALFEHMDRFIRGLESNGHKNEGED
jgi:hypothetical protein